MSRIFGKALVIDNNQKFINEIKDSHKLLEEFPCLISKTFSEALSFLKQNKHQIRVIFLSSAISTSRSIEELRQIRVLRPGLPVFLVSHDQEVDPPELTGPELGFQGIVNRPTSYEELVLELKKIFLQGSWDDVKDDGNEKLQELELKEDGYIPTSLTDFVLTTKSFFNLYIKIGTSRFVKILNAGDPIQKAFLESYVKKGVTHLYITEEEHQKYLIFCDKLSQKILSRHDVSNKQKLTNVLHLGSNITQNIILKGVSPEKMDLANSFLNQSVTLVRSFRMQNANLRKLLAIIESKDHSSTVAFLAGMIANEVGIESSKAVKIVGLAALVHDIGLYDLDPEFKEEETNLTDEQIVIYKKHPQHGAALLQETKLFEEVVIQAVDQHHMRRRGGANMRSTNLNLVTEIIGVSDEIHGLMLMTESQKNADWSHFLNEQLKLFSPQIEKAVVKLLNNDSK